MCHYSGSSFRAALPRRSPSIHRDFGGGKSGQTIRSVNFCLSDMSDKIFPSRPTAPLHLVRVILTLFMGHHPSSLNRYAERAGWWVRPNETFVQHCHKPSRRRGPWSASLCQREALQTREEEQIKQIYYHTAKKVRVWQKASCWEEECCGAAPLQTQPGWLLQH